MGWQVVALIAAIGGTFTGCMWAVCWAAVKLEQAKHQ